METFCGKICEGCSWKEQLSCQGCQNGPGRRWDGDCKIAKCCQEKGHETCATCSFLDSCWTRQGSEQIPKQRLREAERRAEEQRRLEEERRKLDERAPMIGKWLWLLFWLVVPGTVSGFMIYEKVVEWAPAFEIPGLVLNIVCNVAYVVILLKLIPFGERYRPAAWCTLVRVGVDSIVTLVGLEQQSSLWWLLMIPTLVVAYVGEYQEFYAHAEVLEGMDNELSGKWRTLWKWYIGSLAALFGCVLVMVIIPVLGLLALLAAAIAIVVVSILKLVYLYRTAQRFRSHEPERREVLPGETAL